jgi:hypothetical protein
MDESGAPSRERSLDRRNVRHFLLVPSPAFASERSRVLLLLVSLAVDAYL